MKNLIADFILVFLVNVAIADDVLIKELFANQKKQCSSNRPGSCCKASSGRSGRQPASEIYPPAG